MKGHLLRRGEETLSNELLIGIFHRPITRHCFTVLDAIIWFSCIVNLLLKDTYVVLMSGNEQSSIKARTVCFNDPSGPFLLSTRISWSVWFSVKSIYIWMFSTFLVFGCLGFILCTRYNYQKHAYTQKRYFII